jgi:plasmid stabilization system protein ParE
VTPDFLARSAERDLYEAVRWLARDSAAAADAFRKAALASMQRIVKRPMLGAVSA